MLKISENLFNNPFELFGFLDEMLGDNRVMRFCRESEIQGDKLRIIRVQSSGISIFLLSNKFEGGFVCLSRVISTSGEFEYRYGKPSPGHSESGEITMINESWNGLSRENNNISEFILGEWEVINDEETME